MAQPGRQPGSGRHAQQSTGVPRRANLPARHDCRPKPYVRWKRAQLPPRYPRGESRQRPRCRPIRSSRSTKAANRDQAAGKLGTVDDPQKNAAQKLRTTVPRLHIASDRRIDPREIDATASARVPTFKRLEAKAEQPTAGGMKAVRVGLVPGQGGTAARQRSIQAVQEMPARGDHDSQRATCRGPLASGCPARDGSPSAPPATRFPHRAKSGADLAA